MNPSEPKRILVNGWVVHRLLWQRSTPDDQIIVHRRQDYNLTTETDVARLYADTRPNVIPHLPAEVGGIQANMATGLRLVENGRHAGIDKFVHAGTVRAYPKLALIPFRKADLWNGFPEPTKVPYRITKKAIFVKLDAHYRQYGMNSEVLYPSTFTGPSPRANQGGHRSCQMPGTYSAGRPLQIS